MVQHSSQTMVNNRYILGQTLGVGGMGEVYRAYDRLTGDTIALKRMRIGSPVVDDDTNNTMRVGLTNEFKLLSSLRHPNIIAVLDYGFDEQRNPYFTMNYLDNAPSFLQAGRELSFNGKLNLIMQVLQALDYLHRRRIIHRDLKPDNVLVYEEQAKVLDFGLSIVRRPSAASVDDFAAGTLAYMAPELFEGAIANELADIFAAGMMAIELLSEYPYPQNNVAMLISHIMKTPIDFDALEITGELADVLEKAVAKNPSDRYQDAHTFMHELAQATVLQMPTETVAIRESFLQGASFIGRTEEMASVKISLSQAMDEQGALLFVAGESGVGKSRFLDEIRTLALVEGFFVLRSEVKREGTGALAVWQNVLRSLALIVTLNDEDVSVLATVVPDLDTLLDRHIEKALEIDPVEARHRLWHVIDKMLAELEQPTLIILEDLQWASDETFKLLNHLQKQVRQYPLVVVGSYRSDELSDIDRWIDTPKVLQLGRLSVRETAHLSKAILGESGTQPDLLDLLQQATEGNAFFLVEAVRVLADQAGQLRNIVTMTLPRELLAGGIQGIIQQRLSYVPDEAMPLLQMAALAGRVLNLQALSYCDPDRNFDKWLNIGAGAGVLEVVNQEWRFLHEKLREGVILRIDEEQQIKLYHQLATAYETLYADNPTYISTLAHLWHGAQNAEKAFEYALKAAQSHLELDGHAPAIDYCDRAFSWLDAFESNDRAKRELRVLMIRIVTLSASEGYTSPNVEEALMRAQTLAEQVGTDKQLFRVRFGLILMYSARAETVKAYDLAVNLLQMAQQMDDEESLLVAYHTNGWLLFRRGFLRIAWENLSKSAMMYDVKKHGHLGFQNGEDPGLGSWAYGAMILMQLGQAETALEWRKKALDIADELGYTYAKVYANFYAGGMVAVMSQQNEETMRYMREVYELAKNKRYPFFEAMSRLMYGLGMVRGGHPDKEQALEVIQEGLNLWLDVVGAVDPDWWELWVEALLIAGQVERAQQQYDDYLAPIIENHPQFNDASYSLVKGLLAYAQSKFDKADEFLSRALESSVQQGSLLLEARSLYHIGVLYKDMKRHDDARVLIEPFIERIPEVGDNNFYKQVITLLDELR